MSPEERLEHRRASLRIVAERFEIAWERLNDRYETAAGEDFAALMGQDSIGPWLAVTLAVEHPLHAGYGCASLEDAEAQVVRYMGDGIYPENPVAIVNLDDRTVRLVDPEPRWLAPAPLAEETSRAR